MESIQDGTFNEIGLEVLHNIEEKETAQKMKSATEPLTRQTKYKPVDDEEKDADHDDSNKGNPNAVDFLFVC